MWDEWYSCWSCGTCCSTVRRCETDAASSVCVKIYRETCTRSKWSGVWMVYVCEYAGDAGNVARSPASPPVCSFYCTLFVYTHCQPTATERTTFDFPRSQAHRSVRVQVVTASSTKTTTLIVTATAASSNSKPCTTYGGGVLHSRVCVTGNAVAGITGKNNAFLHHIVTVRAFR